MQKFKNLGWSEEEIWTAFKLHAICFSFSEEKIRRTMDFYLHTMKLKLEVIAARPKLLSFGLNKRIHPWYNVIKVLESRRLLNMENKNFWIFALTEKDFLKKYVHKHLDQIPNLLEVYLGTMVVEKMDQLEQIFGYSHSCFHIPVIILSIIYCFISIHGIMTCWHVIWVLMK